MGKLGDCRAGLKGRMQTVAQLEVHSGWPEGINTDAAIIKLARGPRREAFAGRRSYRFRITIATSVTPDLETAQERLDPYMDLEGPQSLIAAIEADETLGGVAELVFTEGGDLGWGEAKTAAIGGVEYLVADLLVEVHAA